MADAPLVRLGVRDVSVTDDPVAIADARDALRAAWYVRVRGMLDASALERAQRDLRSGEVERFEHAGVGVEECFVSDIAAARIEMQLNDARVLALAARLAGVPRVGCFRGRIYRVVPGRGHHDGFHDDLDEGRVLALTLNLSEATYRGSTLQIRAKGANDPIEVLNTTSGDAVLFRLSAELEHRISDIEGEVPKTALAGWFCLYPEFGEGLRERMRRASSTS